MTQLPAGTKVSNGPPAKPMAAERSQAIGAALGKLAGLGDAHLPMVYIQGTIDPPAQVLFVVLDQNAPSQLRNIADAFRQILPSEVSPYVFEPDVFEWRPDDTTLPTARSTGCALNLRPQAEVRRT